MCPDGYVYNLETALGCYDADGYVVHNCHHYVAAEWSYATKHGKPMVGFTATPERADGKPMGNHFTQMIVATTPDELLHQGHLVPIQIVEPSMDLNAGSIASSPAEEWVAHSRGKRGFVFCRSVKHCYQVCEEFAAVGLRAFVVEGSMDKDERADAIQAFRDGELDALINVYILTEGLDVPEAEVCMIARGCGHASTFLQMVGRVLRPAEGKKMATLIDLTGVTSIHGSPLERRIYSLARGIERESEVPISQCPRCGWSKRGSFRICQKCFFQVPSDFEHIPQIDSVPLRTRWAGSETPEEDRLAEWRRLKKTGAPMEVCIREFKKLFHRVPKLTHEEMCSLFSWFHAQGQNRGYKHGYAFARFRSSLGIQPPRKVIQECLFKNRS